MSYSEILQKRFALKQLYPIQQQIVERVLAGNDALVVLPTGSGKSLCYQLPALALPGPGVTLVFSPLIALMEDQVSSLKKKGIRAEFINSTLSKYQREERYAALGEGKYELIYATPERMYKEEFVSALERVPGGIKLLAIDEAHCITKWGHDFRPAYQEVGKFREQLGSPITIALTATATASVRRDILSTLSLDEQQMPLFATGIDRPNLHFRVDEVWDWKEKIERLLEVDEVAQGTGIVYFTLIKHLEEFATEIKRVRKHGKILIYHGQLSGQEKKRIYDEFTASQPEDRLMLLATNAFGMGVDKADIRYIVHAQLPGSVESYYQEVGRAGRDSLPSLCVLLYNQADLAIQQDFVSWLNPDIHLIEEAAGFFADSKHADHDADELRLVITGRNRGDRRAEACISILEKLGVIESSQVQERYRFIRRLEDGEINSEDVDQKKQRDLERLLQVVKMLKAEDLREFVLEYFEFS